jgi:hypothetical protein
VEFVSLQAKFTGGVETCSTIINLTLSVKWVDQLFGLMPEKIVGSTCPLWIPYIHFMDRCNQLHLSLLV